MLQKVCQSVHFRFQIGHVGPILAPSWRSWAPSSPILPPRWVPRGIQKGGKKAFVLQPPAKPPKDPQEAPKMPQKARSMLPNVPKSIPKCSKNPTHCNHYPTLHTVRQFLFISSSPPGLTSFLLSALSGPLLYSNVQLSNSLRATSRDCAETEN